MAYHPKSLQFLSVLQIFVGGISVLLGIASAVLITDFTSVVGFGIWVGIWILVTGLLGFFGSRDLRVPNKCILGTFMGFAITACVFSATMLICCSIALNELSRAIRCYERYRVNFNSYNSYYYSSSYYCSNVSYSRAKAGVGIDSILLIIAILEFAVALASSIYCCNADCPETSRVQATQQVVYLQPSVGHMQPGGVVFMSAGAPGTVMQPPAGQFVMQQPGQPAFVAVSQPGAMPMSTTIQPGAMPMSTTIQPGAMPVSTTIQPGAMPVSTAIQPQLVPGYVATGGQTAQAQLPYKGPEAPPVYTGY